MTPESSPFRPGQPIPIEFFVGRSVEIEGLSSMVRGGAQGRFGIGFVSGERGIGKSSLAAFVRHLVEMIDVAPWSDDEVMEFYRKSFHAGKAEVSDESLKRLKFFTGGLPVLAHEIGDAV